MSRVIWEEERRALRLRRNSLLFRPQLKAHVRNIEIQLQIDLFDSSREEIWVGAQTNEAVTFEDALNGRSEKKLNSRVGFALRLAFFN